MSKAKAVCFVYRFLERHVFSSVGRGWTGLNLFLNLGGKHSVFFNIKYNVSCPYQVREVSLYS